MIFDSSSKRAFLAAPVVFVLCALALLATWAVMEPAALRQAFDQDGYSVFELATIPFYAAIIPLVWWKCPFVGSRRRRILLCAAVSCVAFMAVAKELDWHLWAMKRLFPQIVGPDGNVYGLFKPNGDKLSGTPFKMRFLTNGDVPFAAKACVLFYFGAFFGVFAALLAYYAVPLFKGFFRLHPVAWSIGFFGGSGVLVAVMDRLPAWSADTAKADKKFEIKKDGKDVAKTADSDAQLEAAKKRNPLLAILQAHAIYTRQIAPHCEL